MENQEKKAIVFCSKDIDRDYSDIYLWYSPWSRKTGQQLAEYMNMEHGTRIPKLSKRIVLCWGCRFPKKDKNVAKLLGHYHKKDMKTVFVNSPFKIDLNRNKLIALFQMKERGVLVPRPYHKIEILNKFKKHEENEIQLPTIGRTAKHMGGSGFYFCKTTEDVKKCLEKADYFVDYIKPKDEWRVHVFNEEAVRIGKKVKTSEAKQEIIKSLKRGWKLSPYKLMNEKLPKDIKNIAITAVKTMNLDFGAVDIIRSKKNKLYVLEINTAPGLNKKGRTKFRQFFRNKIMEIRCNHGIPEKKIIEKV